MLRHAIEPGQSVATQFDVRFGAQNVGRLLQGEHGSYQGNHARGHAPFERHFGYWGVHQLRVPVNAHLQAGEVCGRR